MHLTVTCAWCNAPRLPVPGPCTTCGRLRGLAGLAERLYEECWLAAAGLVAGLAEGLWGIEGRPKP